MTIYERVMKDREIRREDRPLLSLIAGEICVDGKPMSDADAIKRMSQMSKVCGKNIDLYTNAENTTMALAECVYRDMVEAYLPQGATASDVENAIKLLNVESDMKSMGKVMGYLKGKFAVVDGNLVKSILLGK